MKKRKQNGFHSQQIRLNTNGVKGYRSFEKAEESKEIEESVKIVLKNGGKIQKIDEGESVYKGRKK